MAAVHRRCRKCRTNSRLPDGSRTCDTHGRTHIQWTGVVDVGADGKRSRRSIGYWETKDEAEAAASELTKKHRLGELVEKRDLTLGQWLDEWLEGPAQMRVKATTLKSYRYQVAIVNRHLGDVKLQTLTLGRIQQFYVHLVNDHGLTTTTARRYHSLLHRALKVATNQTLIERNPLAHDEAFEMRLEAPEHEVWDETQLAAYLSAAMEHRMGTALWLLTYSGARRGAVCGVQWRDINMETGEWTVKRSQLVTGPDTPKTKSGYRTIHLDALTMDVLGQWRRRQKEELLAHGINPLATSDLPVFTTPGGVATIHPDTISHLHLKVETQAGLPHMKMHGLRHLHGSLLLKAGMSPKAVSTRLGHSNVGFTMSTYIRDLKGEQEEAAEAFAQAIPVVVPKAVGGA